MNAVAEVGRVPRRRRRRRWLVVILVALAVLVGAGYLAAAAMVGDAEPPLGFPAGPVAAPAGMLDGTWSVAAGSTAGYRLGQTIMGLRGDVVARTTHVTGSVAIAGGAATTASFDVDLTTLAAGGKIQPGLAAALGTAGQPHATVTLTGPVAFDAAFSSGADFTTTAPGSLSMHGSTHPIVLTLQARRNGSRIEVVGSVPVELGDWGVAVPAGAGFFGELDHHGLAEFELVLTRTGPG